MTDRLSGQGARRAMAALAAATALLAAAPAAAWANNALHIHGPTVNTLGTNFTETVTGHAASPANFVVSGEQFNQGTGCAATYNAERRRGDYTRWPTGTGAVHGSFSLVARFGARNSGTHGICAYLINRSTGKTYAHAGRFWTNKAASSPPPSSGALMPSPVGQGQCQAQSYPDNSVTAQVAVSGASCATATAVEAGADAAKGAPYTSNGFSCQATTEGPGSTWSSAWGGTYYAYSCRSGSAQVAFNWGTDYTFGG